MITRDLQVARKLLTTGNPKVAKGEGHGWLTAILHLAPHTLSGHNVCPFATAQCAAGCLESAGRGGIYGKADTVTVTVADGRRIRTNTIRRARIARTLAYFADPDAFLIKLQKEITAHIARAKRNGLRPAVRLNGTSDIAWEKGRHSNGWTLFEIFPDVVFYDYTKTPSRFNLPDNYSLTFSFSGSNLAASLGALRAGRNVAVVFNVKKGQPLPETWNGFKVIDADLTDLRFLDPRGTVAGLRAKGKAKKIPAGDFIQLGRAS